MRNAAERYKYIFESKELYYSIMKDILLEKGDDDVNISGITFKLLKLLNKILNGIIEIVRTITAKVRFIYKQFTIRAKDVNLGNEAFLSKYKHKLNNIRSRTVKIEGYRMNSDIVYSASALGYMSEEDFASAKDVIFNNKVFFKTDDDINRTIIKIRSNIISSKNYKNSAIIDDNIFIKELEHKYFGDKAERYHYVNEAILVISSYGKKVSQLNELSNQFQRKANNDIRELEQIKKLIVPNGDNLAKKSSIIIDQMNKLIKYRYKTMNDCILAFDVLIDYIETINKQAKAICIKGLQEY